MDHETSWWNFVCFKRFRKKHLKLIKCSLMDIEGENFKAAGCMMEWSQCPKRFSWARSASDGERSEKGVELSNHVLGSMGDAAEAELITTDPCFTICSEKEQGHSSSTAEVIWEDERITRQICCHWSVTKPRSIQSRCTRLRKRNVVLWQVQPLEACSETLRIHGSGSSTTDCVQL